MSTSTSQSQPSMSGTHSPSAVHQSNKVQQIAHIYSTQPNANQQFTISQQSSIEGSFCVQEARIHLLLITLQNCSQYVIIKLEELISQSFIFIDTIWLHVRSMGQWTNRLFEYFRQPESQVISNKRLTASLRNRSHQERTQVGT